ncbi:DUF1093 domain-containing protein [Paenibacillus marinisediminis]
MAIIFMAFLLVYIMVTPDDDLINIAQHWGTKKMYVRITEDGMLKPAEKLQGKEDPLYYYYLVAYDEAGEACTISFSTPNNLHLNSLLLVLVRGTIDANGNHTVGDYELVDIDSVPVTVREKLDPNIGFN